MFIGEFQHSLDAKGRVIIPSKFRADLSDSFIITKGLDGCLFVYELSEWQNFQNKIKSLPLTDVGARKFVRFFFSGAAQCEMDNQYRVTLPLNLREYAGLTKDIVSIGVSNRIEIWDKHKWDEYNSEENFIDNELAQKMALLGI